MTEQLCLNFQPVKRCSECGQVKPLTAFDRAPRRADGRETRCSRCKRAYERRYRAAYPERKAATNAVEQALREGRLQRPDRCQDCNRACLPRAHHESYERQRHLDVEWLCASCHYRRHGQLCGILQQCAVHPFGNGRTGSMAMDERLTKLTSGRPNGQDVQPFGTSSRSAR